MPTRPEQTWWRPSRAAIMFLRGCTIRSASPIAFIVGTLLSAVNQGAVIAHGYADTATWLQVAFNYATPFVVASLGYLSARRARPDEPIDRAADLPPGVSGQATVNRSTSASLDFTAKSPHKLEGSR